MREEDDELRITAPVDRGMHRWGNVASRTTDRREHQDPFDLGEEEFEREMGIGWKRED